MNREYFIGMNREYFIGMNRKYFIDMNKELYASFYFHSQIIVLFSDLENW